MSNKRVLAILCSDLHLSHKPPIARSKEDWYQVMKRYLKQLRILCFRNSWDSSGGRYYPKVICAGDIFDKWNSPPELINFAIEQLPSMYAIPGQHDLPNHNYLDRTKSAYWTLVQARKITNLWPKEPCVILTPDGVPCLRLTGFPWSYTITPTKGELDNAINLAVIHQYIWKIGYGFLGAPSCSIVGTKLRKELRSFDAAIFGDNHIGFLSQFAQNNCEKKPWLNKKKSILNCGGFIRRNSDQVEYCPMVGLLKEDASIETVQLDTSKDKMEFDLPVKKENPELCSAEFIASLKNVISIGRDFNETIRLLLDKQDEMMEGTRSLIKSVLQETGAKSERESTEED